MTAGLENEMRGRRVLMDSLVAHGVRHIFGNPGTTETPLLDSLPAYPQVQYIMALHEGVAVGAASFYAQATRRPVGDTCGCTALGPENSVRSRPVATSTARSSETGTVCGPSTAPVE